jgi:hypothetical protein
MKRPVALMRSLTEQKMPRPKAWRVMMQKTFPGRPRADLEPDGIRVATLTIAGKIAAGTSFAPERIAGRYWEVVRVDGPWQAGFRFTGE